MNGETASNIDSSCEYIEQEFAENQQSVIFQLGSIGETLTTPDRKNEMCCETVKEKASDPDCYFGATRMGHEIWYVEF